MIRPLWPLLAGFTIWALGFVALYTVQGLGCAWGWPASSHRLAIIFTGVIALAALAASFLIQRRFPETQPFQQAGLWATLAASAATIIIFAPALFVSLCV